MPTRIRAMSPWFSRIVFVLSSAWLAACGGDGGSNAGNQSLVDGNVDIYVTDEPVIVNDIVPAGPSLELSTKAYFPVGLNDAWAYTLQEEFRSVSAKLSRTVRRVVGDRIEIDTEMEGAYGIEAYRRTAAGLVAIEPFGDDYPEAARKLIGELLEYPEPFPPIGAARYSIRQGDWGADIDGDGVNDRFRLTIEQTLVDVEPLTLPQRVVSNTAHFRTTMTLAFRFSRAREILYSQIVDDTWLAPGIGLVKSETASRDQAGTAIMPRTTLTIVSARIDGESVLSPDSDGRLRQVALTHRALVYDPIRRLYYATVPRSAAMHANRIVMIDPGNGAVTMIPQSFGTDLNALAISHDGSMLYLGVDGSSELVGLQLPQMTVVSRTRLPDSDGLPVVVNRIAVSPADSRLVAVSLRRADLGYGSTAHRGVALVRSGVLQPRLTPPGLGGDRIVFDGSGRDVYGVHAMAAENGLQRLAVRPDGLEVVGSVDWHQAYWTTMIDWNANRLLVGGLVWRTPDLVSQPIFLGPLMATVSCRTLPNSNRTVCVIDQEHSTPNFVDRKLGVLATDSLAGIARLGYPDAEMPGYLHDFVPGPPGTIALRFGGIPNPYDSMDRIGLFWSPTLQ